MKYKGAYQYEPEATEHHCFVVRIYQTKDGHWFASVAKDAIQIAILGTFATKTEAITHAVYDDTREERTVHEGKAATKDSADDGRQHRRVPDRKRRRNSKVHQSGGKG